MYGFLAKVVQPNDEAVGSAALVQHYIPVYAGWAAWRSRRGGHPWNKSRIDLAAEKQRNQFLICLYLLLRLILLPVVQLVQTVTSFIQKSRRK